MCFLDVLFGDPRWFPHPVRMMGMGIVRYEAFMLAQLRSPWEKRMAGAVLALGLPVGCFALIHGFLEWMTHLNEMLGVVAWVLVGYTTIAARDLWDHAMRVHAALCAGTLLQAREAVQQLVGRDTAHLQESEIVRATVESLAENTSDGVIAPLLYLALGGPALAMAYKAVNTLDSMVGYRNERYRDFGWASARLDDVVNWIPARLTALALCGAASLRCGRGQAAWAVCRRDARNHPSPNSGWPEAAMAGALGVRLGGEAFYNGRVEARPFIGNAGQIHACAHIPLALHLMAWAAGLSMVLLAGGLGW
ncbi:MAG: adenosylcobinamide-phosphate synthase CbiB [Nitrospirales bacterium]|nr:adenosylcobinamide-phosphate synthase CbiB [Nitrospirales bacterium]